jgi:hypothetical protein
LTIFVTDRTNSICPYHNLVSSGQCDDEGHLIPPIQR